MFSQEERSRVTFLPLRSPALQRTSSFLALCSFAWWMRLSKTLSDGVFCIGECEKAGRADEPGKRGCCAWSQAELVFPRSSAAPLSRPQGTDLPPQTLDSGPSEKSPVATADSAAQGLGGPRGSGRLLLGLSGPQLLRCYCCYRGL